ncbi:autotransporter family protein [Methylobacterium planeticum]|nr:autotransporter domain-containing protein [Methylobacterium planeticum]
MVALIATACAPGAAWAQAANTTPSDVNVLNLLAPYLNLNATAIGQATLQTNLQQSIATNNGAGLAQQQLAISDKNLLGSVTNNLSSVGLGTYGAGANLAGGLPAQTSINGIVPQQPVGGLGPLLGQIYVGGSASGAAGPLGATLNLLANAYTFTGNNLGVAKNYFANGAATNPSTTPAGYVAVPAVAPAGYTLPRANGLPNIADSVYDLAYGVRNTQPGQDVYGSSRPVQVVPNRINQFDPTALNGLATNPSFPSGHTTYAFTDGILLAMLVPSQYQGMLARAAEYGNSRIVLGVHYPLDIIGARALASYDLAQAFSNPLYISNAVTTGTAINLPNQFNQASAQLTSYLSAQCGNTVAACAASAANTTNNPYLPSAANQALYQQRLTYGLPTLTFAQAPREAAPANGPDASILLAPLYGGSTDAARAIAPSGGLYGALQTDTINQIIVNTETNALAAFYGSPLSYWSRIDLYSAGGYFGNVTGTLILDPRDQVTTNVTVGSGGTLGGSGTVAGLAVNSGGAVAPGAPNGGIGTLMVAGNLAFAPGATYQVNANAAGQADRIAAAGSATLSGGTVQVTAAQGSYDPRTRYAILTAAGGLTGQFADVTSNLAFLYPSLTYTGTEVDLNLTRNDVAFSSVARNRNQASVADAIQAGGAGTAPFQRTVGLTASEAQGAFQALSGDVHANTVSTEYATAFFVREAILDRLRWGVTPGAADGLNYGNLPAAYTADLPGRAPPVVAVPARILDPRVFGLWGQGFGSFGEARGDGNAAGFSRQISGFALGADVRLENGIKLGAVGGYTYATLDTTGRLQSGTIESGYGGVYGGYELGPVSLRLGATYADNSGRSRRSVLFAGFSDTATARTGGSTIQGFGELGYKIFLGQNSPAPLLSKDGSRPSQAALGYIEPFVGGSYVSIGHDRFTETGGIAALTSFTRTYDMGAVTAGLRGQTDLALGLGAPVSAHGLVGYRRAFGDVVPTALLAFGTGPAFLTAGVPIARDALVAEAGLDLRVAPNATLGVAYTGQVGDRIQDHAVKGNFTYRF